MLEFEFPSCYPDTSDIPNALQLDDCPYALSTVYWIENNKVYEGALLDFSDINGKTFLVVERYSRTYCVIKREHLSLIHPEKDDKDRLYGFSKKLNNDGSYTLQPCYKIGETYNDCWLRIIRKTNVIFT